MTMGRARTTKKSGIYAKVYNNAPIAMSIQLVGHSTRIGQRQLIASNTWSTSYPVTEEGAKRLFFEANAQPETLEDGRQLLRWVYAPSEVDPPTKGE